MSFLQFLDPPTWRHVGCGLSTIFLGLGTLAILQPKTAADALGVVYSSPEGERVNAMGMKFLGIRDIAFAGALFRFYQQGKGEEMGVMVLGWTLVAAVDTWVAASGPKGFDAGIWSLCGGTVVVGTIGMALLGG